MATASAMGVSVADKQILVVDDDDICRDATAHILRSAGYRVRAAADYRLALQAANEELAERKQKVVTAEADVTEADAQLVCADVMFKSDEQLMKERAVGSVRYETSKAQRAVAQARSLGNVLRPRLVIAARHKQLPRRSEQTLAAFGPPFGAPASLRCVHG